MRSGVASALALVAVCAVVAVAATASSSVTAPFSSKHWRSTGRAPATRRHCLSIAVKHTADAKAALEETLNAVSNPRSSRYGQYHTLASLSAVMAPPQERIDSIVNFLTSRADVSLPGGAPEITVADPNRDWIKACMSVAQAEHIFATTLHEHTHATAKRVAVRATAPVNIPADVVQHIDFVSGLNTPIHNYEARKAMVVEPQSANAQGSMRLKTQSASSSSGLSAMESSAPVLSVLYGGNDLMNVGFIMKCQDGNNNTDPAPMVPCTSAPGAPIQSFNLMITPTTASYPPRTLNIPLAQVTLGSDGINAATAYGSFLVEIRKYIGHTVQVQTVFAAGNASAWSLVNTHPVYSTDYVTPTFLKQLYGIPLGLQVKNQASTQSVAEFLEQSFNPADLTAYFNAMGVPQQTVANVIGPNNATDGSINGGEAQLDIQVIMGVAVNAPTWFWLMAGSQYAPEPFEQWLMDVAANPNAPLVHSVSYADAEHSMAQEYTDRLNTEFAKAGTRGLTLLFASGDDGIASYEGRNDTSVCVQSRPEFPSSSPYVLSVGGTQLSYQSSPMCTGTNVRGVPVQCTSVVETVCSAQLGGVITSGGGFSLRYPRPSWQEDAVTAYLNGPTVKPPTGFFNPANRGYPDVAGMAAAYLVQMGPKLVPESGTSASTPLWASMITLWNDIRLSTGQPPLGFINPLLYSLQASHPDVFNDVVTGENNCLVNGLPCCPVGFKAAPGWDPTTGLGSPKFVELSNLMINPNAPFSFIAPQVGAAGSDSSSSNSKTSLILSIIALSVATVAFVGFLVTVCTRPKRQEGLLDTRN